MPINVDNEYSRLKYDIIMLAQNLPQSDVHSLIEEFESVINSKRRGSSIRNCSDLISVLEKRAHISTDNILPLKRIIYRLPHQDQFAMLARLNQDRPRPMPFTPNNHYARQQSHPYSMIDPSINSTQRPSYEMNSHPGILSETVLECISEEIGSKWRDLARKLKLREGDINRIQAEYRSDLRQCAYQCLILYQSKSDRHELEKNLLSALEKARRTDLRNQVQKLLDRKDF